jgi:hypothetical protein
MFPARRKHNSTRVKEKNRFPSHCAWVRGFGCSVPGCEEVPIEAAHVRVGTGGGMGHKPHDKWVISLCRDHHSQQHRIGEQSFERAHGINMKQLAEKFAALSPHRFKWLEANDDD